MIVVAGILPGLSLFGWWDDHLSSSLYSGRTRDALLKLNSPVPATLGIAESAITRQDGAALVDVTAWAFADLAVPPYPAPRVYVKIAEAVPGSTLFIRERTLVGGAIPEFRKVVSSPTVGAEQ
jgi:hypothetical protein